MWLSVECPGCMCAWMAEDEMDGERTHKCPDCGDSLKFPINIMMEKIDG